MNKCGLYTQYKHKDSSGGGMLHPGEQNNLYRYSELFPPDLGRVQPITTLYLIPRGFDRTTVQSSALWEHRRGILINNQDGCHDVCSLVVGRDVFWSVAGEPIMDWEVQTNTHLRIGLALSG